MVARGADAQNEREESEVHQIQRSQAPPYSSSKSPSWAPAEDLQLFTTTFQHLHTSGWYWGGMAASEARDTLTGASEGTFLVRDSSHPLYLFTLSVKTWRGPTNIRIEYDSGRFRLDSSIPARSSLLSFSAFPGLVQHYVSHSQGKEGERIAEEHQVVSKDNAVLLKLRKPLYRPDAFPTLQHLARLIINRQSDCHTQLPLPRPLLLYLQEYPFQV
ncbi:cytokine inducible SH2-containing protein b [Myxocyprinus asiaticus]|uniref:cytokine inducible SH2-containing protein b n=1 Tax=Myxocyprinus asiaticus TaxID=70543 RepID=UPI0022220A20|nr:cytokine inducible SH2-containing protein b [Myxocyprinus asiaticus]XP_051532468.1 cytokine inducible SH2-containing protein b [Myxocyprinus asiaticus]